MKWIQLPAVTLMLALAAAAFYAGLALGPSMATASQLSVRSNQHEYRLALRPMPGDQVGRESQPEDRLALLTSEVEVQGSELVFSGLVRNLSDRPIRDLLAVVTMADEDGVPRASASALVDDTSLAPGQISRWRVATRRRPELTSFGVEFREWHIGSVPTRDDRKD